MNQSWFDCLKLGKDTWNTYRKNNPEEIPDLSGEIINDWNFDGYDLVNTKFDGATVSGADFRNATGLAVSQFARTVLIGTRFPDDCLFEGPERINT